MGTIPPHPDFALLLHSNMPKLVFMCHPLDIGIIVIIISNIYSLSDFGVSRNVIGKCYLEVTELY